MSSFFTLPASQRKRKRKDATVNGGNVRPRKVRRDESISGSDYEEEQEEQIQGSGDDEGDSSDDALNTDADRRLKLAEQYLDNIRAQLGEEQEVGFDAADIDREVIAARLKEDVDEEKGKLYRRIAGDLDVSAASSICCRTETLATTAVASCAPYMYTATKDARIMKWQLTPLPRTTASKDTARKKPKQLLHTRGKQSSKNHHTGSILCLAASSDGKFLASGGEDRRLIVWETSTLTPLKVFTEHRDAVTALAFRGKTNQLFSGSRDRSVKIWSLNELAYVETLFGHQDEVVDVAAVGGSEERCVSVGARDRSARLWKVVDESQLVFRGGESKYSKSNNGEEEGSLDRVMQATSQLFVTGSDAGTLSLFALRKKKPLHAIPLAHGLDPPPDPVEQFPESIKQVSSDVMMERLARANRLEAPVPEPTPRWITAIACVPFTDLVVTGSWDGVVRVWRISEDQRRIEALGVLGGESQRPAIRGVVNDLTTFERGERGREGVCVIAAVGKETRLGRWKQVKKGRNGFVVFEIPRKMHATGE